MKENLTRIAVILDRSGSMESVREATIEGFNKFVESQREGAGEATLKLVQFDSVYEQVFDKPLAQVPELTAAIFVPRGNTALLDAQGQTIDDLGKELAGIEESERPSKVIVMTLTDGLENASKRYTEGRVAEMVKHQREVYGWEFIYLGANQDAVRVAAAMNIPMGGTMTYSANKTGMRNTMAAAAKYVSRARSSAGSSAAPASFSAEDRASAMVAEEKDK